MIISASRRTDIPAFFSDWFISKINQGFTTFVNPYNPNQKNRIDLSPDNVDLFVFWSKYPKPMIKYLPVLDKLGYKYFFQFTLTPYGKLFEPNLPNLKSKINTFILLSDMIGPDKIIWRYDPVIISDISNFNYHINAFKYIALKLYNKTNRVVFSFFDDYRGALKRLNIIAKKRNINFESNPMIRDKFGFFLKEISHIAQSFNMEISTCAESHEEIKNLSGISPEVFGIKKGSCISKSYIENTFKITVSGKKDRNQRKECGCIESKDIGMYNTCPFKCEYCYADSVFSVIDNNIKKFLSL